MAPGSQRPGPLRTSCLTCRRRHKKCDQRQPTCERCERGDFECLGYGDPPSASVTRSSRRLLPKPAKNEGSSIQVASPGSPGSESTRTGSLSLRGPSKDIVSAYLPLGSSTSGLNPSGKSVAVADSPVSLLRRIVVSHAQRSNPLKTCLDGNWLIETIIAQVEKAMSRWHLKPTNHQKEYFRQDAAQRLRKSKFTCWVSLIGMSVIESFLAGDVSRSQLHSNCIDFMEGSLRHELTLDLVPREIHDRRRDLVHVSLMKTMLVHSSNTYQLLRSLTPAFLQVAYSTPALWSSDCDFTRIPMMNIMISGCHELAYFVLVDCTYATISGLPQQVEYDTTIHPRPRGSHSHQWAHSSPTEMLLVLADINACRDKSPAARNWKDVEQWLLTWQFPPSEQGFTESRMTVTWYAVRESWRLSLLVYLYLAACGASSDDPRIRTCIKQILQLISMIKKQGASDASVSFFFLQYLMVGICARSEAHRQVVRDKLATADDTKLWLMRTPDLVPVLDHLWHGAAAGGRPIKWSDYVHSREIVLPIGL